MNSNWKISSPWSQLGLFLALLGGGLICTAIVGTLILGMSGVKLQEVLNATDPRVIGILKLNQSISSVFLFLLPAILYARFTFRTRQLPALGFKNADKTIFYALGVAIMLFAFPLEGWLGQLNKGIPLPTWAIDTERAADKQIGLFLKANSPAEILLNVIVMAIIPAICEEACFRGALQRILIQVFRNPWGGIIATAIFFSAFHMQFEGFLPRMFLGVILGALYWYSGSLWTSILAHCVTNGVQVVAASYYPDLVSKDPSVSLYAMLVSLLLVSGLLIYMRRLSTLSYACVYEETPL